MELRFPLAEEPDDAAREAARKLFVGEVDFLKGVVAMNGLPPDVMHDMYHSLELVGHSSSPARARSCIFLVGSRTKRKQWITTTTCRKNW